VRKRIQVSANVWRMVEGVMADRKISRKLKGKVMVSCMMPAYLYGLKMVALTERQEQRSQVCENNWVRRIARVKMVDGRRRNELREEIGVQMSLTGRLVKCRLKWTGQSERMAEERMAKRADRLREKGRRKRGKLRLWWDDYVRRDIYKVGVVEEWIEFG